MFLGLLHRESLLRRWAAFVCLLAMLLGLPGVVPGFIAVVAQLDGSHQVQVSASELVLHHDQPAGGLRALHHHHCLAARLVVLLAEPETRESDHVLKFSAGAAAVKPDSVAWISPDIGRELELAALTAHDWFREALPLSLLPSERVPPRFAANLVSLRSTVLLI